MSEMQVIITGDITVITIAIQNTYMKLYLWKLTMTAVMTGNVTQFSIDLTKLLFRVFKHEDEKENLVEIQERMKKVGTVIPGFLFEAIGRAFLFMNFTLMSVLLPVVLVLLAACQISKSIASHPN
jgi:uncharacterized membrane protein YoaK (UPF0700 family)